MFTLNGCDKARLKEIIAAGGLRDLSDVLRIAIEPVRSEDAPRWLEYLHRNSDAVVEWARNLCGDENIVLLDEGVLTLIRHPATSLETADLRLLLVAYLTDRLSGNEVLPIEKLVMRDLPPESAAKWLASAAAQGEPESASPAALSPAPRPLAKERERIRYEDMEQELTQELTFRFDAVAREGGDTAWFVRVQGASAAFLQIRDYCAPSNEAAEVDLASIREAAHLAFDGLRQQAGRAPCVLFPININNLRLSHLRAKLLFELRQIPKPVSRLMEPVLVRCTPGVPQAAYFDASLYLRSFFPTIWTFVSAEFDPRLFTWPQIMLGVLLDLSVSGDQQARSRLAEGWRSEAKRRRLPLSMLSDGSCRTPPRAPARARAC
ncbi:MAG TPA: hypothetical protein VEA80_04630 [Vitreimonas sp.]|uniref:hypothetical protein n=1 Tax=Vitreimonas sp. TaxID=3069702 RepID=UPI002D70B98C|nr:hypothetical protein [Vitreimonas sp.]HYD86738.1 hypothetical protein [Vitreimonas sp.]